MPNYVLTTTAVPGSAAWQNITAILSPVTASYGNTVIVDAVNGDDAAGAVNGPAFLTPEAALDYVQTNALTGVVIWVFPGTYTLSAGITLTSGNALRGLSVQTTRFTLAANNPGGTVTMLTMEENTRVEDLSFALTSTDPTTHLIGLDLPGSASTSSKLRTCVLTVDNHTVPVGSSTNVYGIYDNGTGVLGPGSFSFNFTRGVTVNVISNGGGAKRAVLVTGANDITFRDTNFYVAAPVDPASAGSYVGVETTNDDADAEFRTCSISGPTTAGGYTGSDIHQTAPLIGVITNKGIQLGPGCDLLHKTAGGKPFTTYVTPTTLLYGLHGNVQNATRYLWPGVQATADTTQVFYRFQQKSIVQGLSVNARTAPGAGSSFTVTVLRSVTGVAGSGVATVMTATVTDANTSAYQFGASVDFAQGEYLAVQVASAAPGLSADVTVEIDIF